MLGDGLMVDPSYALRALAGSHLRRGLGAQVSWELVVDGLLRAQRGGSR